MNRKALGVLQWILPLAAGVLCALAVSALLILPAKWAIASLLGLLLLAAAVIYGNPSRFFLVVLTLSVPFAAASHTFLKREDYQGLATAGIAFGVVECALLALYATWFLRLMTEREPKLRLASIPNILVLGFIVVSSLSLVNSPDRALSGFELVRMLKIYLVFFYVANATSCRDLGYIAAGLLFGVFLQSGLGIAQYVTHSSLGLGLLGGAEENMSVAIGDREDFRVAGTTLHPNQYALFLSTLLPLALSVLLSVEQKAWARLSAGLVFALGLVGLLLSFSRTGWICLASAVALLILIAVLLGRMTSRQFLGISVAGAVGTMVAVAFSRQIVDRLFASHADATLIRRDLVNLAWAMIRQHPFVGIGLNNFVCVQERWDPIGVSFVRNVHNLYALIWAETGLFALLIFVALLIFLFALLIRPIRSSTGVVRLVALGIAAGWFAYALDGLADYSYRMDVGHTLFWFLAGLILAVHRISREEEAETHASQARAGIWSNAGATLPQEL